MKGSGLRRFAVAGVSTLAVAGAVAGCGAGNTASPPAPSQPQLPESQISIHSVTRGHNGRHLRLTVQNPGGRRSGDVQVRVGELTRYALGVKQVTPAVVTSSTNKVRVGQDGLVDFGTLPAGATVHVCLDVPRLGDPSTTYELGGDLHVQVDGQQVRFTDPTRRTENPYRPSVLRQLTTDYWGNHVGAGMN